VKRLAAGDFNLLQAQCLLPFCPLIACRTESSKKKPPIYKVMLHNDNYNRREYVVKILLKTVEGLTVDDAVNVMQVGIHSTERLSDTRYSAAAFMWH